MSQRTNSQHPRTTVRQVIDPDWGRVWRVSYGCEYHHPDRSFWSWTAAVMCAFAHRCPPLLPLAA